MSDRIILQKAARGKVVNLPKSIASTIDYMLRDQKRLWNWFHDLNTSHYAATGEFIFYREAAALLTGQRRQGLFSGGSIAAQQQCLQNYERALKNSFPNSKNRRGFPKPRRRAEDCSIRIPAVGAAKVMIGDELTHAKFPKIGLVRVRNLKIPDKARINSFILKKQADGYWVSVQYSVDIEQPINNNSAAVGIDAGLSVMASFSNGEQIPALKPLRKSLKKLRRAQRQAARKRRGSINRRRADRKVARIHCKVRDARRNAQHQLSSRLIKENGLIAIETLSLSGLKRLKHQGFAWSDIGIGELYRQLRYKAGWAGVSVYEHPRFARSTGCCPDCLYIGERLDRKIRSWTCTQCNVHHDRDIAAGRWLEMCALRAQVGTASPEPAGVHLQPKRGSRSHSTTSAIAAMRPDPDGSPAHGGSPANEPLDVVCLAHGSAG